jgi:hypothetical protein
VAFLRDHHSAPGPSVAITARGPRWRSRSQASAIARRLLVARSATPVAWASSISFSTAMSTHFSILAGWGRNGAMFSTVRAPACRACIISACVVSTGVSNCATQTSSLRALPRTMALVK